MTLTKSRELIEKLAIETKHSSNEDKWYIDQLQGVKEFKSHHLEAQISELMKAYFLVDEGKNSCEKNVEST